MKKAFTSVIVGLSVFGISSLNALEFGSMGNLSASMGGAGVALKSPFALYYNPALIAGDKTRFGYSLGLGLRQSKFDKLSSIDFSKIMDSLANVGSSFTTKPSGGAGGGGGGGSGVSNPSSFGDALVDALKTTVNSGSGSGSTSSGGNDLESLWKQYQAQQGNSTDYSKLVDNLKNSINKSSGITESDKNLFNGIADSLDWSNFDISSGTITNLTIKKGSNPGLDEAMDGLNTLFEVLKSGNIDISSQSGVAFQLSLGEAGALAVGIFNTAKAGVYLKADPSRLRLIFGKDNSYYELQLTDSGYTLKTSDKNSYEKYSILTSLDGGDSHKLASSLFNLTEIPIGYAYNFRLNDSNNLSLGASFKLMHALNLYYEQSFSGKNLKPNFSNITSGDTTNSFAFGLDLGAYYAYDFSPSSQIAFGFVAKNLNTPTFRFASSPSVSIKPQYRAGVAYNGSFFSLAFDVDLSQNELINYSLNRRVSQTIGGGVKFDLKYIDLRAGLLYDFRQDDGLVFTGGINLFGFFDLAFEVGTKWVNYFGYTAPKYATLKLGGSFSF